LLSANSYPGFTNQTAHLAGYVVSGIGIILFFNWKEKLSYKLISTLFLIVLIIGLLLAAKRAHFVFMIIAVLFTFLFSLNNKAFIKYMMRFVLSILTLVILVVLLYNSINFSEDS